MKNKYLSIFFLSILSLSACKVNVPAITIGIPTSTTPTPTPTVDSDLFTSSIIASPAYSGRTYDLVKAQSGSKAPTYMQWISNNANTTGAAVIIYYPYEVIDWSGETVDSKWSMFSGAHDDEDGPYFNISTSSQISVSQMPHATAADNTSIFFANTNNVHVLIVYGRYYAGTDIAGDVQAVVDGYRFLNSKAIVDKTRIGIYSGSWGGIGVLYGTKAAASYNIKPKTISLAYPVSDVKLLTNYLTSIPGLTASVPKQTQYSAFFDPYLRRINKATEALAGQATRYDKYKQSELSSIDSSIFIIHDKWDTLVPSTITTSLYSTMSSANKYVYYQPHATAIDYDNFVVNHSQASQPVDYTTALTWNYMFLIAELTDPTNTRATGFSLSTFLSQFQHMKAMYDLGQDTSSFNKVLSILCRPNLFLSDRDPGGANHNSAYAFYFIMENYYQSGWSFDSTTACAKLITNPPF